MIDVLELKLIEMIQELEKRIEKLEIDVEFIKNNLQVPKEYH